ncbi:MAG: nitroreductase [bacterium]|nr:MAG: nitroreductase [bacterium]
MPIAALLEHRRSVRAFLPRPVSTDDIEGLMEAARWSPSNGNRQPWRYILRVEEAARAALGPCLNRGNQWAMAAPLLITQPTVVIAVGYEGGGERLDERTREKEAKPRVRRPINAIRASDRWSEPWSESP